MPYSALLSPSISQLDPMPLKLFERHSPDVLGEQLSRLCYLHLCFLLQDAELPVTVMYVNADLTNGGE